MITVDGSLCLFLAATLVNMFDGHEDGSFCLAMGEPHQSDDQVWIWNSQPKGER